MPEPKRGLKPSISRRTGSREGGRSHEMESNIMVELVDYKCAVCGSLESFHRERNGISCKACGSRIFMKLRRNGTKRLVAE
jgi:DNA-directed RNA polymerase subunit RPC12/RpoP